MTTASGSYVNTMVKFAEDRVQVFYGPAKYERLVRIKIQDDQTTSSTSTPASTRSAADLTNVA